MEELFNYLYSEKITPNEIFVLFMLKSNVVYNNYVNTTVAIQKLKLDGLIETNKKGDLQLTNKGNLTLVKFDEVLAKTKKLKKVKIDFSDWEEMLSSYVTIFPKGIRKGGNDRYRCTAKDLYQRFVWFFAEYPEYNDWKLIHAATEAYVTQTLSTKDGERYLATAKYFVKKEEKTGSVITSRLADWCYLVKNDEQDTIVQTENKKYYGSNIV